MTKPSMAVVIITCILHHKDATFTVTSSPLTWNENGFTRDQSLMPSADLRPPSHPMFGELRAIIRSYYWPTMAMLGRRRPIPRSLMPPFPPRAKPPPRHESAHFGFLHSTRLSDLNSNPKLNQMIWYETWEKNIQILSVSRIRYIWHLFGAEEDGGRDCEGWDGHHRLIFSYTHSYGRHRLDRYHHHQPHCHPFPH